MPLKLRLICPEIRRQKRCSNIRDIGCEYVGLLVPNSVMDDAVIEQINRVYDLAREYGMKLQYHNHDYEYTNMVNGQYRMDFILEKANPEVLFEPDLGGWRSEDIEPRRRCASMPNASKSCI